MAWQTPVIDRENGQTRTTYADMNRINGNLNIICGTNLREDYTANDIVTVDEWQATVAAAQSKNTFGLNITDATTYTNLNNIEKIPYYIQYGIKPLTLSFRLSKKLGGSRL